MEKSLISRSWFVQGAESRESDSIMNDDIGAAESDQLIPQLSLCA